MTFIDENNPFKLPTGEHTCQACKGEWMEDIHEGEEIICPYCKQEQIYFIEKGE